MSKAVKKGIIQRCALLPVNVIATAVGFATLSNMWEVAVGFPSVRVVTMGIMSLVWLAAIIKMTVHYKTFKADYTLLVPSSLYATFSMLTMLLGAFIFEYIQVAGQVVWLAGVTLHALHVCIFTYRFVLKGIVLDTFVPTWFVTYMGLMVVITSGMPLGFAPILQVAMIYGYVVYPVIFVSMLVRIIKRPLPETIKPTGAIFLAPSSMFFISYLNMTPQPIDAVVVGVYIIIFITIIRVATLIPSYLRVPFGPGLAALTFPTAIALVSTFRMVGYLNYTGREAAANLLNHFFGIQLYLTTAIIAYVGYKFLFLFLDSYKPSTPPASGDCSAAEQDQAHPGVPCKK